jgi:hypothetical protein
MTEKATEPKAPEVIVKKAPAKAKAKAEPKPKLNAATAKQLQELAAEIARLEGLKADRTALMKKAHAAKAPTSEIAEAAGLSVPRARQVLGK